jgi:hypothetical protein
LQLVDRGEHLPHLIGLRFTSVILNIYPRVAGPWRLEYDVAGALLASFAEVVAQTLYKSP